MSDVPAMSGNENAEMILFVTNKQVNRVNSRWHVSHLSSSERRYGL